MASLVLGAAGALVGSFFGPLGTSIGWAVGSSIGAGLFQKGQSGPRLTDLKMHNSSYGQMIPLLYGTDRIAGNISWQTDLVEHEQKSGGKGGPTVTTYTYTASFAVHLCEGPILGVKRIWADSRLVFDPIGGLSQANFPFTLYLGDETQLPDPTIEAHEGVGNVNANRGVAYVVFADMLLTDYGNRIPSLTFEVYTATQSIPWRFSTFTPFNNASRAGPGGSGPQSAALDSSGNLVLGFLDGTASSAVVTFPATLEIKTYDTTGALLSTDLTTSVPPPADIGGTHYTVYMCQNNPHICWAIGGPVSSHSLLISAFYYDGVITCSPIYDPTGSSNPTVLGTNAINCMPVFGNDAIYGIGGNIGAHISKWSAPSGVCTDGHPVTNYYLPGTDSAAAWTLTIDDVGDIWAKHNVPTGSHDCLYHLDADLNVIDSWPAASIPADFHGGICFTVWDGILCFKGTVNIEAYTIDPLGFTPTVTGTTPGSNYPSNGISLGNGLVLVDDGIVALTPRPAGARLSDIVTDLSVRSGLVSAQLDVTDLTDIVDGYVISQQGPTRGMIEPLQTAYFFDAVESDTLAKFVKRGRASQLSIPDSDLGAFVSGGTPPPITTVARVQEVDLPRIINCVYVNEGTDYQNGTQISQRLITSSQMSVSLQLAIVMTDKKAKEITDALLFNAWLERDKVIYLVPRKLTYLEPTDVIDAHGYTVRITDKAETVPGVIKLEGVVTQPYVWSQQGLGIPGLAPPPSPPPISAQATDLLMLDIPLVVDTDYPNGYYAAMAGATSATWPGASLFKSIDGGVNYANLLADVVPDTIGGATTVLGPYNGGNTFDETNSVTVQLRAGAGSLEGHSEIEVLNGANEAVLGDELLQFKNATLVGAKLYTLTGLLRGRRGTEWAMQHRAGDRFAMLPTSVNVNGPFPEVFVQRDFKAVTSGSTLASATNVPFTNNGAALRCYSPVQIGGALNATGDLAISWLRRTRIGGTWQNFVDVPLSEATESYVVQIWDATFTNCARILTSSTPSVTYTAADQVTDFGATQLTIFVTVGQIGTIGLGTQQGASLMGAGATIDPVLSPIPPYGSGPPSPPPSGGCTGTVFNQTLTFALGTVGPLTMPSGFAPGTNWVLKLTTPASGNFVGELDFFEYGGPTCTKHAVLATGACGAPLIPACDQTSTHPSIVFSVGDPFYPTVYANLAFGTDYYFSLQTTQLGGSAVGLTISAR